MRRLLAALAFDDGYMEQLAVARELYRMDVQATFFVITGLRTYMGRGLMGGREWRILKDMGHEVASHTDSHKDLARLGPEEVERELAVSRERIAEAIGEEPRGLAYPYGSFNEAVLGLVPKHYGYARTMGFNRWNKPPARYAVGSTGVRHLFKIPFARPELVVVVFHLDLWAVRPALEYLRLLGARLRPLGDLIASSSPDA